MTEQEERFVHLVSCIRDLNNAWRILQEIKQFKDKPLIVGAAFRFALVEYSKPFKNSVGVVLNSKGKANKYKLNDQHVPPNHRDLHQEILARRDQLHAHSDLTVRDAKLYVSKTGSGKIAQIVENLIFGTEELDRLDDIISLIEGSLDKLYEEEKRLESQLPTS
jgi:hypothetical protein